jgi:hypothetical protein
VQELHSIPLDQPLAARLVEAIDALDTYHDRIGTLLAPVDTAGTQHRAPTPDRDAAGEPRTRRSHHEDLPAVARMDVIYEAVTKLLEPDQQHLRLPAGTLADAFLGLYSGRKRTAHPDPSRLPARQLVDLFMHGALTSSHTRPRSGS